MDIVFVILNYVNCQLTYSCVESIRENMSKAAYQIIIVDNGSEDNVVESLEEKYRNSSDVVLIMNKDNLGFAKGNNVGIRYARTHYSPKYICTLNSDVELQTDNIVEVLDDLNNKTNFSVLGPLILSGDGRYDSNPMADHLYSVKEIDKEILHSQKSILLNKMHLWNLWNHIKMLRQKKLCSTRMKEPMNYRKEQRNVKLHGACLFFSEEFFDCLSGFDESTFLYMEEDILFLHIIVNGLTTIYTPRIIVYHAESASTQVEKNMQSKRIDFIYSNRLKSQLIYKELLLKYSIREEE